VPVVVVVGVVVVLVVVVVVVGVVVVVLVVGWWPLDLLAARVRWVRASRKKCSRCQAQSGMGRGALLGRRPASS
jgi:hypothetical protein